MNKNTLLNLLKLFVVLVLSNAVAFPQNGETPKSGCGGKTAKTATSVSDLASRRWQLAEINGTKVENTAPFVEFSQAEKRFAGNAGSRAPSFGGYVHARLFFTLHAGK